VSQKRWVFCPDTLDAIRRTLGLGCPICRVSGETDGLGNWATHCSCGTPLVRPSVNRHGEHHWPKPPEDQPPPKRGRIMLV